MRPWLWVLVLAATVLALSSGKDVVAEDPENWQLHFDGVVFGKREDQSRAATRIRMDQILRRRIEALDRCCGLSDAQKGKLDLAGRVAISQLVESIDAQQRVFLSAEGDKSELQRALPHDPRIIALRSKIRSGPFDGESLFAKTMRTVLTPEQVAKIDERAERAAASNKPIGLANARDLIRTTRLRKSACQIAWTRDATRVAFLEFNNQVEIYDMPPAAEAVQYFGAGKRVVGFDFCPDEIHVAIAENSETAVLINVTEGTEVRLQTGQSQPGVKFSPDGKWLATGGYGTAVKLWSVASGELVRQFDVGPSKGGLTPVFSPDGTVLAVGHRNHTTRLFDVASGRLLHTLEQPMTQGLRFDPTGKTLAATYVNGHLALWDVQTGKLKIRVRAPAEELYSVDWSPDGSLLATSGSDAHVLLWNSTDLSILNELESPSWVICVRFSPDGSKLMFAGGRGVPEDERIVETWAVP